MCIDTQHYSMILGINENEHFQLCHTSRDNTRAGFESAPLVSVETGSSSILRYVLGFNLLLSPVDLIE
jgi:hypothetical protein